MPVYNVEKYIERSLLSALSQTYSDIEYLIIDDKGTDNSIELVKKIACSHLRGRDIRIIDHGSNKGTGATKNTAISVARGQYIFFMDSDDTIAPNAIELLYNKIVETNSDLVCASYRVVKDGKTIDERIYPSIHVEGRCSISEWMIKTNLFFHIPTWNKLYNVDFLRSNEIYCIPHHRNEDTVFSFQVALYAKSITSLDDVTYTYYMIPGSTVHQSKNDFYYNQYLEILEERVKLFMAHRDLQTRVMFNYLVEPFFDYFIEYILYSDQDYQKKVDFFNRMKILLKLGYKLDDLSCSKFRSIFEYLEKGNLEELMRFYKIEKYKYVVHRILTKRLHMPLPSISSHP